MSRAARLGQDIVDHGDVVASGIQTLFPIPQSGCQPPKKKRKQSGKKLFDKRLEKANAAQSIMKIASHKSVNETHRSYKVLKTEKSRSPYEVVISTQPSCSCPDFKKFGTEVHCTHIMFVVMHGHGVTDTSIFQNLEFSDEVLIDIFNKPVRDQVIRPPQPANRSSSIPQKRKAILSAHPDYNNPQSYTLIYKASRSAKCQGYHCEKIFQIGSTCVKVEGGISIPWQKDFARKEELFFCPSIICIRQPPVWTNLRFPTLISTDNVALKDLEKELNDQITRGTTSMA